MDLSDHRLDYETEGIDAQDLAADPYEQLRAWLEVAIANPPGEWFEANAMTLSTADAAGRVSSRIVLLKGIEPAGLIFYTNYSSHKADDLAANAQAALCFYWGQFNRQIRIEGTVEKVSRQMTEEYFASRPRASQLGAVVSDQSRVVASRQQLEQALAAASKQYEGQPIPVPEDWGGYRLVPTEFEFWQGRHSRLHDRLRYRQQGTGWALDRLGP